MHSQGKFRVGAHEDGKGGANLDQNRRRFYCIIGEEVKWEICCRSTQWHMLSHSIVRIEQGEAVVHHSSRSTTNFGFNIAWRSESR